MAELIKLARTGKILPTDTVWREGQPPIWTPASQALNLFSATSLIAVPEMISEPKATDPKTVPIPPTDSVPMRPVIPSDSALDVVVNWLIGLSILGLCLSFVLLDNHLDVTGGIKPWRGAGEAIP